MYSTDTAKFYQESNRPDLSFMYDLRQFLKTQPDPKYQDCNCCINQKKQKCKGFKQSTVYIRNMCNYFSQVGRWEKHKEQEFCRKALKILCMKVGREDYRQILQF